MIVRLRVLLLTACMAALWACASTTEPQTEDRLLGAWNWLEATGGIAGRTVTPDSTGETMRLDFLGGDRVELYRNGELERQTRYSLAQAPGGGETFVYEEALFGFDSQSISLAHPDTLVLSDPCCDGFTYVFAREGGGQP